MSFSTPKAGATLRDAVIAEFDWADADLTDAVFINCTITQAQFSNTVLDGVRFAQCRLVGCRMSHVEAREVAFEDCVLTDPETHQGVEIAFSRLEQARFANCDLSFARWERSDLYGLQMEACNLRGARFDRLDLAKRFGRQVVRTDSSFRRCNFHLAALAELDLHGCDFNGSRFREADLSSANLEDADLSDCDLFGANLARAKLAGADLRRAEISGLNLEILASRAKLKITASQQHALLAALGVEVSLT